MSNTGQLILVLDDDLMVTDALAAGLQRPDRTVITCNDLESAQLVVERMNPSHIVSDVRLSGPFAYEGLDFVHYALRHAPGSRIIMMTGDAPPELQLEASQRGAVAFLQKPFEISELDAVIDLMSEVSAAEAGETSVVRLPLLDEILNSSDLRPMFQPIVRLSGVWEHVGYEALARFRSDSIFNRPEILFEYAARKRRICDLEVVCARRALEGGAKLARQGPLFLNVHPAVFMTCSRLRDALVAESRRSDVQLDRVVLEVTEQGSLADDPRVLEGFEDLRKLGIRFAFDDVGVAYSHLPLIGKVRPSFLKISQHFGTAFESDATKTKIVRNLMQLAQDFGCDLILEGVEDLATAEAATSMGIRHAQGYLFGRPAEASAFGKGSRPASS